jgi:hypothetical protein
MDPLISIQTMIAGGWIGTGLIAGIFSIGGILIVGHQQRTARKEDWARQDTVAAKLIMSNQHVADNASRTFKQLEGISVTTDIIHTLVNSDLTKAIQGQLDKTIISVSLAQQVVDLHKKAGIEPPPEVLGIIEAASESISSLKADLAQREKQQSIVEEHKSVVDRASGQTQI